MKIALRRGRKRDILGFSCWAVNHPLQDAPSKNVVNVIRVHDSSSKSDASNASSNLKC